MSSSASVKKKYTSRAAALETVEHTLRARIAAGHWSPGIMLPSRRDLAKEFDVDLHTLQRAILPLLDDGTLQADGGRGTFVAKETFVASERPGDSPALPRTAPLPPAPRTGPAAASAASEAARQQVGTLGIIAAYDTSRVGAFDVAGVGTRDILRSLERTFSEAGGKTRFFNLFRPDGPWATVPDAGAALLAQGVEALAVVGIQNDPLLGDIALPEDLPGAVPVIHISGCGSYQPQVHVYYDQRQAGYQAAEHLLQVGCRNLLFFVPFSEPWLAERVEGARIALRHASVPAEALRVYPASPLVGYWSPEVEASSAAAIRRAFSEGQVEGGVITPNDGVAHLVLEIGAEYGLRAGRDYALIGFDDVPQSSFCGLTSIRPPFEEMGGEAGRLLLRQLGGEPIHLQVCLRPHLMVRDSTRQYAALRLAV